jgi:hypothetical protein
VINQPENGVLSLHGQDNDAEAGEKGHHRSKCSNIPEQVSHHALPFRYVFNLFFFCSFVNKQNIRRTLLVNKL